MAKPGIVDAQVHLWGANTPERPWPPGRDHLAQKPYPVTKELILAGMDEAGIDRVVLVPPSWEGDRNDLALQAAAMHPDRFAVMGRIDLGTPQPGLIPAWREQPGMLGLRFTFHRGEQRAWLTDGTAEWAWKACEDAGVPVMVFVPGSVPATGEVAERYPGLKLVIDHLACAGEPGPERFDHLPEVLALAKYPNIAEGLCPAVHDDGDVSVPGPAADYPASVRRLRARADVLGHGLDAAAVHLARGARPVRSGVRRLAEGRGPGDGDGRGGVSMAGVGVDPSGRPGDPGGTGQVVATAATVDR